MINNETLIIEALLQSEGTISRDYLDKLMMYIYGKMDTTIKYKNIPIEDYESFQRIVNNDYIIEQSRILKHAIKLDGNNIKVINRQLLEGHGIVGD